MKREANYFKPWSAEHYERVFDQIIEGVEASRPNDPDMALNRLWAKTIFQLRKRRTALQDERADLRHNQAANALSQVHGVLQPQVAAGTYLEQRLVRDCWDRTKKIPMWRKEALEADLAAISAAYKVGQACLAIKANRARPGDADYAIRIHFITAASRFRLDSLHFAERPEHWEGKKHTFDLSHEIAVAIYDANPGDGLFQYFLEQAYCEKPEWVTQDVEQLKAKGVQAQDHALQNPAQRSYGQQGEVLRAANEQVEQQRLAQEQQQLQQQQQLAQQQQQQQQQ